MNFIAIGWDGPGEYLLKHPAPWSLEILVKYHFLQTRENPCQVFILHKYWHRRRYYSANLTSVSDVQTRGILYIVIFKVTVVCTHRSVHLYSRNQPTSEVESAHKVIASCESDAELSTSAPNYLRLSVNVIEWQALRRWHSLKKWFGIQVCWVYGYKSVFCVL